MGAQECAPLVIAHGRGRDPPAAQDLADRARADAVSQAAQLALDADNAPGPVLACETDDQLDELAVEWRPSRGPGPGPFSGHHTAVPAQQRARGHDSAQAQFSGQQPGQCREHGPVIGLSQVNVLGRPARSGGPLAGAVSRLAIQGSGLAPSVLVSGPA